MNPINAASESIAPTTRMGRSKPPRKPAFSTHMTARFIASFPVLSDATLSKSHPVKQIEIRTDDGQTLVRTLRDETGVQEVNLGDLINPRGILITILDVYPGQKYDDTCLSYVMADFSF